MSKGGSFDTAAITGPALSDAASWNRPHYFMTASWLGGASLSLVSGNGSGGDGGIGDEGGPVTPVQGAQDGGVPVGGGDEVGTAAEAHGCGAAGGGLELVGLVALVGAGVMARRRE